MRVLRPARRIHIRRRGRVLRNSPPPASVRSATDPNRGRAWLPREFGAVLGGSASLPLPAPPLPSSSRRYAPQCFVGGIPPPRLATCFTAHPTNRVAACRSVRHSPPRPLPHLPIGAFFFVVFALADVPSARLTLSAYPRSETESPKTSSMRGANPPLTYPTLTLLTLSDPNPTLPSPRGKSAAWSRQDMITTVNYHRSGRL